MPPPSSRPPVVKGAGGRAEARAARASGQGVGGDVTSSDDEAPAAKKGPASAGAGADHGPDGELLPEAAGWELEEDDLR